MQDEALFLPPFSDLGALADQLARAGRPQLRGMISQASKTQSCMGDLRQAIDCVSVLAKMVGRTKSEDTSELLATECALLTTAVMLYARATLTNGRRGERGPVQLDESKLTPEQWRDHCLLLDVRNQALAHVYSSKEVADHNWHRGLFFAVSTMRGDWKVASSTNQTSFHQPTYLRLQNLLPVAHENLRTKFLKQIGAVTDHINREVRADMLLQHLFDPIEAFGSLEGVQRVLAGAGPGEASFWVYDGIDCLADAGQKGADKPPT